jgi:hypothetical protein
MNMNKKLIPTLAAFAALSTVAFAGMITYSISADFDACNRGGQVPVNHGPDYVGTGAQFTASVSGIGSGGGAAYAVDTSNGSFIVFANTGGNSGQSYSASDSHSFSSGGLVQFDANISADSAGAKGTATISASW